MKNLIIILLLLVIGSGVYWYMNDNKEDSKEDSKSFYQEEVSGTGFIITSPKVGDVVKSGEPFVVEWENNSSLDNTFSFVSLIHDPEQSFCGIDGKEYPLAGDSQSGLVVSGSTTKKLSDENTCRFKIKVISNKDASVMGEMNGYFTITP